MSGPVLVSLFSAALNAGIGALAYARGRGQSLYRSFAILSLSFALWNLAYVGAWPDFADPFWMKLLFSPLAWLPAAGLSFVWCFTGLPEADRRLRTTPLYAAGFLLLGLLWTGGVSIDFYRMAFLVFLFPTFGLCAGLLFLHWRRAPDPAERNRRGYLLAAALIATSGSATDFLPHLYIWGVPPLANVSLMAYSLIVLAAISRHDLLDLSAAAGRAALLAGAALVLSLLLTGLAWATRRLEGPLFVNYFLLSLLLLAVIPPLWERAGQALARALFSRRYRVEKALSELERLLEGVWEPSKIAQAARELMREAWNAEASLLWVPGALRGLEASPQLPASLQVLLKDRSGAATAAGLEREGGPESLSLLSALRERQAEAVAVLRREGELVGALLAGRPDADFYDLAALRWLERLALALGRSLRAAELTAGLLRADRLAQLGTLSAGIAHEIRNPLTAMLGAIELLEMRPQDKRPEYLEILKSEVRRLEGTLTELLDYASAKPGQARCQWKEVWTRVEKLLRAELPLELSLESQGASAELAVSSAHLQQILLNLVKNAARAVREAPQPRISVSASPRDGALVLSVSDNGPGISPEILPRLFSPFATASPGGTGLGLSTIRRLAELYGGRAWAENREKGARFSVKLPLAPGKSGPAAA